MTFLVYSELSGRADTSQGPAYPSLLTLAHSPQRLRKNTDVASATLRREESLQVRVCSSASWQTGRCVSTPVSPETSSSSHKTSVRASHPTPHCPPASQRWPPPVISLSLSLVWHWPPDTVHLPSQGHALCQDSTASVGLCGLGL